MDDYSSKRAGDGLVVSRRGSALVLRDTANNRDKNAQFCNRIGCNGRMNSTKSTQISNRISCSGKAKYSKPSLRSSSSGKEIIGSSSGIFPEISNPRKSLLEPQKKLSYQLGTYSSETGSVQDKPEVLECVSPAGKIQRGPYSDEAGSSEITSMEVGSSTMATRSRRNFHQKSGFSNTDTLVRLPVSLASRSSSQGTRVNANKYGLRNLRCNSISDVVPMSPSSSDSKLNRRKDMVKKRIYDGESSSSTHGKKISSSSLEGRNSSCRPGISISDSRRARSGPPNRDNAAASVRTQRSLTGYTGARVINHRSGRNLSLNECHVASPQVSQPDIPTDLNSSTSNQYSVEASLSHPSNYGQSSSSSESLWGIRPSSPAEVGNTPSLMNWDSFQRYNMDGIAEVLLALERIEQDEELTYEQLLVLETNLFLNGLNIYDQHRDMRLDIDNMSYEELLALEERMGTVSTALTEEALSECLKASIYQLAPTEGATTDFVDAKDDVKCSICQEEYATGEEVGSLQCEHGYHLVCIHQWLRQKNWCPICKAAAAPLSSPPSS